MTMIAVSGNLYHLGTMRVANGIIPKEKKKELERHAWYRGDTVIFDDTFSEDIMVIADWLIPSAMNKLGSVRFGMATRA